MTNNGLQFLKSVLGFVQAEVAMRADGKPGMSDEEVCSLTRLFTDGRGSKTDLLTG
jgi:hypothetical protein